MKKERGFVMAWWGYLLILALVVAVVFGAIRGAIKAVNDHDESIRSSAYAAGRAQALKEVADRDNKELTSAQAQIMALQLEKDTAAALHAEQQARLKRDHDKEVADANRKTDDLLRRVRAGELVFYDPGAQPGAGGGVGLNAGSGGFGLKAGAVAATAGGSGQTLGAGLSRPAAEFLLREADRADEVARDLALCWGIARDDRARRPASP